MLQRCLILLGSFFVLQMIGCEKPEIQKFRVAKQSTIERDNPMPLQKDKPKMPPHAHMPMASSKRMFVQIVLVDKEAWFFKLTAETSVILSQLQDISKWLESVRFEKKANGIEPAWQLPKGWTSKSVKNGFGGFMDINIPTPETNATFKVSHLPYRPPVNQFLLGNINRWRRQLGQPPLTPDQLSSAYTKKPVGDREGYLVLISSQAAPKPPVRKSPPPTKPKIAYKTPKGWTPKKATSGFQEYAFSVKDKEKGEQITISISIAGGPLVPNINRWRRQVGLKPLPEKEVKESISEISIAGKKAVYTELVGPKSGTDQKTIYIAIRPLSDRQDYFFKLIGSAKLAERERENFKKFLESISIK